MASSSQTFIPFDTSFGAGGAIADYAPNFAYRSDLIRLADGRLLLAGYVQSQSGSSLRQALARFTADGKPDPTFGSGGQAVIAGAPTTSTAPNVQLAVQPDGKILVGTAVKVGEEQQWVLTRTTSTGTVDSSFSGDGRLSVSFPGDPTVLVLSALLVRPDDTILAVGFRDGSELCLARYLPNGSRDRNFGEEGKLQVKLPGAKARATTALLDGDDRIVVAGAAGLPDSQFDMLVARYGSDGTPDQAFGFEGSALVDFGTGFDFGQRMALDAEGRILVAGVAEAREGRRPAVIRLLADGSPDPAFGSAGQVRIATGKPSGDFTVTDLDVLPGGRIAVAATFKAEEQGHPDHDLPKTLVAVRRPDGSPDQSFEPTSGVVTVGPGSPVSPTRMMAIGDVLLVAASRSLIRLHTTTSFAALRLSIGATPNPASAGPLTFVVTVSNDGDAPAGGLVRLRCSKPVSVTSSTGGRFTVDANRIDVIGKVASIPAGGSIAVQLRTSVNGFEEGVELSGSVNSGSLEVDTADNTAAILVTVSRFATI